MQHIYVRARNTGSGTWQATGCAGEKSQLVVTVNNELCTLILKNTFWLGTMSSQ